MRSQLIAFAQWLHSLSSRKTAPLPRADAVFVERKIDKGVDAPCAFTDAFESAEKDEPSIAVAVLNQNTGAQWAYTSHTKQFPLVAVALYDAGGTNDKVHWTWNDSDKFAQLVYLLLELCVH